MAATKAGVAMPTAVATVATLPRRRRSAEKSPSVMPIPRMRMDA